MWIFLFILGFISFASVSEGFGSFDRKSWTYEIISIECKSSDTDLLIFELQKERISRGNYAVSGQLVLKFDIVENDANTITAKTYRSSMGDGDYKLLPLQLSTMHWHQYFNTFYKDALMELLHDCSDAPYFTDKFVPPIEKRKYTLTKCQISQEGFPSYLQEGRYKFVVYGNGTVSWGVEIIVDVQTNV